MLGNVIAEKVLLIGVPQKFQPVIENLSRGILVQFNPIEDARSDFSPSRVSLAITRTSARIEARMGISGPLCRLGFTVSLAFNPVVELHQYAVGVECEEGADVPLRVGEGFDAPGNLNALGDQLIRQSAHVRDRE